MWKGLPTQLRLICNSFILVLFYLALHENLTREHNFAFVSLKYGVEQVWHPQSGDQRPCGISDMLQGDTKRDKQGLAGRMRLIQCLVGDESGGRRNKPETASVGG